MRYLITIVIAALSLNAVGQTNPNYNPDYDANGSISVNDLLGFLSIFGDTWDSGDVILGCTYSNATDYNPLATMDDGSCTFLPDCAGDECGVCGGSGIADGACDCDGNVLDECGVCGGDNSTCTDCCGVPNGNGSTCDGACGACGDDTSCLDDCGVPNGDNSTCLDECGVPNGNNSCLDECGVPNGDNSTCADDCGVPNGDNSCLDDCGVPNGDNSTCLDECGVPNGDNSCLDECGVPNGDNSTCADDCGVPNGDNSCLDECGVPNGDNSTCLPGCGDGIMHGGYNYSTVQIGGQCWFSENCRYLPSVSLPHEGSNYNPYYYVGGFYGYDVEAAKSTSYYETYGVLYNWPAVMAEGICPSGWHIPSDGEFTQLTDFLGGYGVAGGKMKEAGYDHWLSPNTGATNSSGWTGLPGVYRYSGGFSSNAEELGTWWSTSEFGSETLKSLDRNLYYNNDGIGQSANNRYYGFSARCLRNSTDDCGVPNGDNSCLDECGVPNGDNSTCLDECGVPNGDNSTCLDCCGVVNGDGTSCDGACGACGDDTSCLDDCGVPNGDNSTCADCCGVANGDGSTCDGTCGPCNDNTSCLDDCDVPNGDNSTCGCDGVPNYVISHDGYNYSTVQIGDQCWFAENCRYLPNVSPSSSFSETTPYYYVYDYQGTDVAAAQATINYETYGVLYNWPAIMTEDICPSAWHVPSDEEFTQLTDYLGGNAVAGAAMKSATAWDGTNSSGFNGLPAGIAYSGDFGFSGSNSYWWSSSASGSADAWFRLLVNNNDGILRADAGLITGYSARCVRD